MYCGRAASPTFRTLANAGGVIFIGQHVLGNSADAARREVRRLADSVAMVLARSASPGTRAGDVVVRLARERLAT